MIVVPTLHEAAGMAQNMGLRGGEWLHISRLEQVRGRRVGRYTVCTHGHEYPSQMMEIVYRLKDPTLGFQHLPHDRVRRLVVRDRAAETE